MAAIVFDIRNAERRLMQAGASQELAEATADLMSEAVVQNLDALVTKDYLDQALDARFSQQDARFEQRFHDFEAKIDTRFHDLEAKIDKRFRDFEAKIDKRFRDFEAKIDKRFHDFEVKIDRRFHDTDARYEERFHSIDSRFLELKGEFRVMKVIQALLLAGVFLPQIRALFA